jgi:hypothetical protein
MSGACRILSPRRGRHDTAQWEVRVFLATEPSGFRVLVHSCTFDQEPMAWRWAEQVINAERGHLKHDAYFVATVSRPDLEFHAATVCLLDPSGPLDWDEAPSTGHGS